MQGLKGLSGLSGLIPATTGGSGALTITDSFDRAPSSESLGSTDTGQPWVAHSGTWGISGNLAYIAISGGFDVATVDAGAADVAVSVTFTVLPIGGDGAARLILRYVDSENYIFLQGTAADSGYALYKLVSGSPAEIALSGTPVAPNDGDRVTVNANGPNYTVTVNSEPSLTGSDAAHATAEEHGIGYATDASAMGARWNDFEIDAAA